MASNTDYLNFVLELLREVFVFRAWTQKIQNSVQQLTVQRKEKKMLPRGYMLKSKRLINTKFRNCWKKEYRQNGGRQAEYS